jgi:hypothetical protein
LPPRCQSRGGQIGAIPPPDFLRVHQSLSELVNEAVREALAEDAEDLAAFDERAEEPAIPYDEMVMRLRKDGRI